MDVLTIIIALGLLFVAWKILMGLIRIGAVVLILGAAFWAVNGGLA
ncbi:MAG: hypothetical protein AAF127_02385 [Pseudomonadota bacterium]